MATELTIAQWSEILLNRDLTKAFDLDIFKTLYGCENYQAPASRIGEVLGYQGKNTASPINLEIGRYAKRIATLYDIDFSLRENGKFKYWDLFFNGWADSTYFIWELKHNLRVALEQTNNTGQLVYPEELSNEDVEFFIEGSVQQSQVNSYERNPKARKACIDYWKPICSVCGFDFEKVYGDIGKGFIHVHHIVDIATIGSKYSVDPIKDLIPVCPNCHSMLHKKKPAYLVSELKKLMKSI